ncbi:MAG TPA: tetratricopeptide repeat protein [Stellaceae bacterium]|nr:tetratricopeptide repeat protein [Stellaceae bacterium]
MPRHGGGEFLLAWRRGLAAGVMLAALGSCVQAQKGADNPVAAAMSGEQSPLGSYLAARHAQQSHDYDSAARLMERALADDPNNIDLVRRSFVLRISDGHVAEAVPLAQRLVDLDGNSGLAAIVLLVEDIKAGKLDDAAQRAKTLARAGPQRYAMPLLTAWIEAGRQHPAPARQALDQMGDLKGLEPLRELHLGMIADYADDIDAAQAAFDKLVASQAEPTFRVVEVAGNFYERRGRSAEATKLYQSFASADGETGIAAAGLKRIAAGQVPERIIATAQQGAAEALFDLASLLNQRDTVDASLIYVRLALDLQPNFPLAQLLAAEIRDGQGRTDDALAFYRAVDPNSSLAWSARLRAAIALDALDQTDAAAAELKAMAAERPNDDEPLVELGDVLRTHNRYDAAAQAYDQAIARLPKVDAGAWRIFYDRGVALERSGQWPRAEADLKHALALSPDEPLVLNYLGYSWIDKGENLPDAMKMIQRAVELRPNDGYIVDSLGWAYFRTGDVPKATQFLERAIELLPEDPTINDHLGDVYWRSGRLNEARFQWRRALQFGPDAGDIKGIETKLDRGLDKSPQAMSGG